MNERKRSSPGEQIDAGHAGQLRRELFDFEAPFLEEQLRREGTFHARVEYQSAFTELKKYFLLDALGYRHLPMTSRTIDGVWHQFILFTKEYHEFCNRFFGQYLHHSPSLSHADDAGDLSLVMEFFRVYKENFGPIPRLWIDNQMVHNEALGMLDPWDGSQ